MRLAQYILIAALRFYRWILSPAKDVLFGPSGQCRFHPSCSAYALEALQTHGAWKGTWLALKRLGRCHPWGAFGPDPVPSKSDTSQSKTLEKRGDAAHSPAERDWREERCATKTAKPLECAASPRFRTADSF